MKKSVLGRSLMLLMAAAIWGTTFVAQSEASVSPFTFNCSRFVLGALVLLPVIAIFDRVNKNKRRLFAFTKCELVGGVFCGVVLCVASALQQFGIGMTSAGKSAFITALYVVLVPVLGIFTKRKVSARIWGCVILALFGATLLSADFSEGGSINMGDFLCLLCAIAFSLHIVVIDRYSPNADGVRMSCVQFFTAGLLSFPLMLIFEHPEFSEISADWLPICYAGLLSCGIAYTLQIVGQKDCPPATASIILSLESVFGAISAAIILGIIGKNPEEIMNLREIVGCATVFLAVILAQLPERNKCK